MNSLNHGLRNMGKPEGTPGIARFVLISFFIFLMGYFLFPERRYQYLYYYLLVLLPAIPVYWQQRTLWLQDKTLLASLALITFLTSSLLWSGELDWRCAFFTLAQGILTASFVFIVFYLRHQFPEQFRHWLKAVLVLAALASIYHIADFVMEAPSWTARMFSLGQFMHPNSLGVAFGLLAVMAAGFMFTAGPAWEKSGFVVIGLIFAAVVLLSQSRNALLSAGAGLFILFAYYARHGYWRYILILAVAGAGLLLVAGLPVLERLQSAGLPYRIDMWKIALEQIQSAWLFGHGICSAISLAVREMTFNHPHNVYLATAWYSGLIGLSLFLWLLARALSDAWFALRHKGEPLYLALIITCALAFLPDFHSLISRPREVWFYFWFPVGMAAAVRWQAGLGRR